MATAILSSQNHRFDHQNLAHRDPNSRLCRHPRSATMAPRRRKRSPTASSQSPMVESPAAAKINLVMEKVKILKRGETLSSFLNKENSSCDDTRRRPVLKMKMNDVDLIVSSTKRLGPEPKIVMKQIGALKGLEIGALKGLEIFAGAGCSISPPPCSVPIPCFLEKNNLFV